LKDYSVFIIGVCHCKMNRCGGNRAYYCGRGWRKGRLFGEPWRVMAIYSVQGLDVLAEMGEQGISTHEEHVPTLSYVFD
jgi:hypothetical protein